ADHIKSTIMEGKVCVCLLVVQLVSCSPLQQAKKTEVLGILKPADVTNTGTFPSYILDLLPELMAASSQIKSNDVVDTLMAYMPFARKIMAAQSPDGQLTARQENMLRFNEKVTPPMMRFVEGISGGSSLTDMPLNAIPDDKFTDAMLRMLPDVSTIINQMKAKYGGWPGTDKALEIMNAFMPLARKATLYEAELEGRQMTAEEDSFLNFAERVVPSLMEYSQAMYYNALQPGHEDQITQLVKSAVEDLHKTTNKASINSFTRNQLQTSQNDQNSEEDF
ncbi:unnamed protein product, partial [Meganyctiphanes norvegica]